MKSTGLLNGERQDTPVIHVENGVVMKESDNTSPSELLHDCLIIWRRLKKDNCAKAENIIQTSTNGTVQTSKMSVSRRLRNRRPSSSGIDDENSRTSGGASVSSENDDESNGPCENSEQCKGVILSCEVQNCSKGRAERESEQAFKSRSGNNLKNVSPETYPCGIMQQEEQDNLHVVGMAALILPRNQLLFLILKSSVQEKVTQHGTNNDHLDARRKYELVVGCEIEKTLEADGAKSGEQIASSSTVLKLLDKKAAAHCSMDDDGMKVNVSVCSNQDSEIAQFSATKLDEGTTGKFLDKAVNLSMGSDCRDTQWGATDCNVLRTKQEHTQHPDSEQDMHHMEREEDYVSSQALAVASNQQVPRQFDSDRDNPCTTRQADWNSCSLIPDLNSLPSMNTGEEPMPFEKVNHLLNGDGTKPQTDSKSLLAASCEPTLKEPNRKPEPSELIGGICEKEGANRFQSPNSHSGPSQQSIVEESSMPIDAFKCALSSKMQDANKPAKHSMDCSSHRDHKNLSQAHSKEEAQLVEVYKIIVRKTVDKVTTVLGSKVPLTDIDICRFLSDESQNLDKLVQDYLDLYLGKEVLKRKHSQ
uniref:Uncharacterized protein n=1 Tax=Leersia perrieri TaxID=77586 RepID=A0A0D9VW11_9ORYZ